MRVLVLDGNENQAVASVRSLARAGHRVLVGADTSWSKAGWSRYASGTFRYPSPRDGTLAFVDAIAAEAAREPGTLVLPMTERSTLPLSALRERVLAAGAHMVLPSHDVLKRTFDKSCTTQLADGLGIAVPRTATARDRAAAIAAVEQMEPPFVLKPRASEEISSAGATRTGGAPVYARTRADVPAAFDEVARRAGDVLIQEFIPGGGAGYFALCDRGNVRAEFAHRRLRDVRPTGSGSALRESVALDPRVASAGRAILHALQWHGPAMVEFRIRADGTPVFLEVNGRFWNSLALAIHAGVDFPRLVAELAEHGTVDVQPAYRTGVRCRWLLGDARHLAEVMRGAPAGYPLPFPSRMGTLLAELRPVPGTFHDNFAWSDPLPELGDWLHFLTRTLPGAARTG